MKITYVITRSDVFGGASVHLLHLAIHAQQRGHDVSLLIGGNGVVATRARSLGLATYTLRHLVRPIRPLADLLAFFEIRKWLKQLQPTLVHLHSTKAALLGRLAARSLGLPVIYTAHGWPFTEGVSAPVAWLYRHWELWLSPLVQHFITVSAYDRELALTHRIASASNITVIHNGVPLLANATHGPAGATTRIIMVARFEKQKAQDLLLHALAQLSSQPWQLTFVGDGPLMAACQQLAASLGLASRINFAGARSDVAGLLCNADIFVLASRWEGLPLTILEAMRASLPVIASDVGGVGEAVSHGQTGLLVPRDDIPALTAALAKLLNEPAYREQLGENGLLRFQQMFTLEHCAERTLAVYDSIIAAAAKP